MDKFHYHCTKTNININRNYSIGACLNYTTATLLLSKPQKPPQTYKIHNLIFVLNTDLEHFPESHFFSAAHGHHLVRVVLQRFLDKPQQMLLVHARSGVNVRVHFSDVVKVTMRHRFLRRQLSEFVQENM